MKSSWFTLLILAVAMIGCGPSSKETNKNDLPDSESLTKVTLQLNWYPEAEHGGFYSALVHGYYKDAGLDVKIIPGGPGVPVVQKVADGQVDFGVANADRILLLRAQEADVVALMAPLQNSPRCLMVQKNSGVTKFDELGGFTIAIDNQPFAEFLRKKILPKDVNYVPFSGGVSHVLQSVHNAQQGYSFSEPYSAQEQGVETNSLMVSDVGFNPYASCLVTTSKSVTDRKEIVRRMTEASIHGWSRYLTDPVETNRHILKENPEMTAEVLEFGVRTMRPLCEPAEGEAPCGMLADRWTTLAKQMTDTGSLDAKTDAATGAFTLEFLTTKSTATD
ncbi:ABC transporter substrate-binding protein [Calycomorphotria hydatis]|uniref:NMT1/THI5 like protein n=1 Tax=Calycomorphotria hydatis TaxID=2528027 RepID=A0A517T7K3_9PLAN|nr:ABC transporter substrate-binding protein [Calycomorphotria hydatis]QDT64358.1 NMT1/THI5 like protein [Calycomorphotria hydatis]